MTTTTSFHLIHSELLKLITTRMPAAFGAVLVVLAVINGIAVVAGTDMDGSKTFISTGADQQSLIAFAANAMMLAGLFGAIAAAREYAHNTVIATFLTTPDRPRALGAQLVAIAVGGGLIGLVGALLTTAALALTLPFTEFGFMVSAAGLAQVLAASAWAGAAGAVLGAGIGTVVRNTGGAVSGAVLALVIIPPVVVQLASGSAPWVPTNLALVASGVTDDVSPIAAVTVLGLWALLPAAIALWSIQRRDVV